MNRNPVTAILHMRFLSFLNHFTRPTSEKVFRWGLIFTLGTLLLIGDYVFFYRMIKYLDGLPLQIGEELIVQLINVVFLTLFAMVLFSSLIASLSIYYISDDLEFLISQPIPQKTIINSRLGQTIINSTWVVWVFSIPIFCAYGYYFDASIGYYFYLIAAFFPFVVLPCILGVLGIMILIRNFPTQKIYQILSFLSIFILASLVMFLRFLSPEKFFGKDVSDEMIMGFVESLKVPEYSFLPTSWITRGLTSWVEKDYTASFYQLGYLLAAGIIFYILFNFVSRKIYFQGWLLFKEVKNAPASTRTKKSKNNLSWNWIPMNISRRALLIKDIKIFVRDPAQWSQVFVLVALVIVYVFNIINLPRDNLVLMGVVSLLNIGLVGFILAGLISRFVFSSTSIEGTAFWAIYTSPVAMKNFISSKFWMFFPPLLFIAELLVISSNYLMEVDSYVMWASVTGVFFITFALVCLGIGMGAMYPLFRYENISEISTGTGGILFIISSLIYVGVVVVLSARPLYVHYNDVFLFKDVGGIEVPICYGLIIILTAIVAIVPLRRGINNLQTMDI
jgi:ABC-2 type transport system permease protein